ncbi:MAG TPA: response regulator transcription factor [Anaerolineae bacterium]|nr:response regulator transcription factor [Anaerolineae bacterium]
MKSNATILIVDDHAAVLESMAMTLEAEGYQVLTAVDGVQALTLLESQPVDLILADIAMPRMNGYQLLERARANPAWVAIPFLFLTARAMDSDVRYGKELGADDYLTKPIEPEDVVAAVQGRLLRVRQLEGATAAQGRTAGREGQVLVLGRLRIDASQHRVWMDDHPVRLSAREFTVLDYLARQSGQVVTPEDLIRVTHGLDTNRVEAGTLLRPLVRSVRRKLGYSVGELGCIETVRGVGYLLNPV